MDDGVLIYPGTIRFKRMLPCSSLRAWNYLTVPALLSTWLADAEIDLRVNGKILLRFDVEEVPERKEGGAIVRGFISQCVPGRRLSYSWEDSAVCFELSAEGDKTDLVFSHSGLTDTLVPKCGAGWHTHLEVLQAQIAGDAAPPFLPLYRRLLEHYKAQHVTPKEKERRQLAAIGSRKDRRRSPRGADFV